MARIDWVRIISSFGLIGVGLYTGKVVFEAGRKEERRILTERLETLRNEILKMAEEFETKEENNEENEEA